MAHAPKKSNTATQGPPPRPPQHAPHRARLLRLGLPPAVSLAVHALLLGLIILIGVGIEKAPGLRPRLAEIATEPSQAADSPDQSPVMGAALPTIQPASTAPISPGANAPESFVSARAGLDPRAMSVLPGSTLGASPTSLTDPAAARTPTASFAGLEAKAAGRIVYVVDASGAVVPTLTYIKRRLARSIDRLAPTQKFEIVFFREPAAGATDVPPRPRFAGGLVAATGQTRADAVEWIDTINAAGRSDPSAAMAEAMAMKPDLVFLLSTSIQRTQTDASAQRSQLLALLDALNPVNKRTGQRPVVIKALQFLRPDPANLLRDIALIHGDGEGSYRLLTATQLDTIDDEPDDTTPDAADPFTAVAARLLANLDAAAWPVVLGLPTETERAALQRSADGVLDTLDRTPETSRDTRWALLHQRAQLLHASATPGGPDRPRLARLSSTPVRGVLTDPGADLERRLIRVLLDGLARDPSAQTGATPAPLASLSEEAHEGGFMGIALRAALGSIVCREPDSPTDIQALVAGDPRSLLLLAEARARAALDANPADPHAFEPLLALLDDTSLHRSPSIRRALVWGRVAAADDSFTIDWANAPAPVALARASVLATSAASKPEGLAALDALAARDTPDDDAPNIKADNETKAEALWQGAIAERDLASHNDAALARVGARLRQLVQRFPGSAHARDAAAAALALGTTDTGVLPESMPSEFVSLALTTFPDHAAADRWRLGLAHRASGDGPLRLIILEQIPPGSPEERRAADLYLRTVDELAGQPGSTARPGSTAMLERALAYTHARGMIEWYSLALRTARACESGESPDPARAADLYLALAQAPQAERHDAGLSARPDDLRLDAGRALLASGQAVVGIGLLTDLASRLEASGDRNAHFWRAWAMVLEALADSPNPGERAQGLAHGSRLGLIDPTFGGDEVGRRISEALHRLDSAHDHDPAHGSADPG